MFVNQDRVLCIAPHMDDEVIGCGGSLVIHSEKGADICVIYVIRREPIPGMSQDYDYAQESINACNILGVTRRITLEHISRPLRFDNKVLRELVKEIRSFQPEVVYIPHEHEGDREHRLVHEIGREAVWMASSPHFEECGPVVPPVHAVLGYEVWTPMPTYQLVQDITAYMDRKIAALRAYHSQIQERAYDDAIQGLNRYRAVMTGMGQYAEVFKIYKLRSATS